MMKRRILLVGGLPTGLPEARAELSDLVPEWEFLLARGSLEALDHLTRAPCDAVVAVLHQPDLGGLQLLDQVMKQWPQTHRIILADLGELDSLLRCVGGVHQFLTLPCEARRLQAVLERAFRLEAWLPNQAVRQLLGRLPKLPSPARTYDAVVAELERSSLSEAASLIAQDPPMCAKILQLANSAAYGPPLDESDPVNAAHELGLVNTRRMLLLAHSYSNFRELTSEAFPIPALWRHAQRTARWAAAIARVEDAGPELVRQAETAGLLHDLGKVALAANLPGKYQRAQELARAKGLTSWEAEQEVFGTTHGEVAGSLLGIWGLPMPVVEAAAMHHHPARFLSDTFSPLTAVHAANALDHAETPEAARALLDRNYLAELKLEEHLPAWWRCRETVTAETVS